MSTIAPLRIAVADDEPRMVDYYRDILPLIGHRVTSAARTGRELVEGCRREPPDVVITDIKMPDMDGIDAATEVCKAVPVPVILVSAYHEPALFERAKGDQILAYLVKPIKRADLEAAIAIAVRRFEQFKALRREAGDLRQSLEDRKVIERAKGVLMKRGGLDESDAFHRLQRQARQHNQRLIDVARMVLVAEEALRVPTPSAG